MTSRRNLCLIFELQTQLISWFLHPVIDYIAVRNNEQYVGTDTDMRHRLPATQRGLTIIGKIFKTCPLEEKDEWAGIKSSRNTIVESELESRTMDSPPKPSPNARCQQALSFLILLASPLRVWNAMAEKTSLGPTKGTLRAKIATNRWVLLAFIQLICDFTYSTLCSHLPHCAAFQQRNSTT